MANQKPTERQTDIQFRQLLEEAVSKPGTLMKAYSLFWNYSLGNQILALVQRISETNGMSVVSGRRLTGFLAGLRRRITRFMSTSQRELPRSADFFRGGRRK